jgi:hypothetical protein
MSSSSGTHRYHDLTSFDLPYSRHLNAQADKYASADLTRFESDPIVRSVKGGEAVDAYHQALARSGRKVVALYDESGSFRTNPDLAVSVGGIIAVKPKLHWLRKQAPDGLGKALAVSAFRDPMTLFDAAARLRLDGRKWEQYTDHFKFGGGEEIGSFPVTGTSFASLWLSLSDEQRRQVLDTGLKGSALDARQLDLFTRAIYRSFYNGSSKVFPLEQLAPSQIKDCTLRLRMQLAVRYYWKRKDTGKEAHSTLAKVTHTDWKLQDQQFIAAAVSVAYLYDLEVSSGGTLVFTHHGSIMSELARGNTAMVERALTQFRRDFGL